MSRYWSIVVGSEDSGTSTGRIAGKDEDKDEDLIALVGVEAKGPYNGEETSPR